MKRSTVDSLQNPANITSHAHVFITPFAPLLSLFSNTILLLFVCLHFSFHDKFSVFFLLWLPQQLLFRQTREMFRFFLFASLLFFQTCPTHLSCLCASLDNLLGQRKPNVVYVTCLASSSWASSEADVVNIGIHYSDGDIFILNIYCLHRKWGGHDGIEPGSLAWHRNRFDWIISNFLNTFFIPRGFISKSCKYFFFLFVH